MPATKRQTSFTGLCCPLCDDVSEGIALNLSDLSDCSCSACGDSFTIASAIAKAEETLALWRKVERLAAFGRELASE
jgi:hypothetical protein